MDKYIFISGASRGIGRAIALKFASFGHNLIIVSSNSEKDLTDTMEEIKKFNVKCRAFTLSVADFNSLESMKETLHNEDIFVECVINNAGISYFGLLQDMSVEDWNNIININLSSIFNTSKLFINDMIKQKCGSIINISSVWGNIGASCEVAYSASKGGMNSFTKALAKELAPCGINVNAIACGAIDTSMNSRLDEDEKQALCDEIPAGRMGTSAEVAELVYSVFKSDKYLTGQIITMDGGWT
ncbi:MAG: SDR family oxidoreductase [Lachnospiraceae bacterium]|nr:SDR family oxidoreductase [Lachnospiraceae bacterium]